MIKLICVNNKAQKNLGAAPEGTLEEGKEYIATKLDSYGLYTIPTMPHPCNSSCTWSEKRFMDAEEYYKQHSQQYEIY